MGQTAISTGVDWTENSVPVLGALEASPNSSRRAVALIPAPVLTPGPAALSAAGMVNTALCPKEGDAGRGWRRNCKGSGQFPQIGSSEFGETSGIAQRKRNRRWSKTASQSGPSTRHSPRRLAARVPLRPPPAFRLHALREVRLQAVRTRVLRVSEWARGLESASMDRSSPLLPVSQLPLYLSRSRLQRRRHVLASRATADLLLSLILAARTPAPARPHYRGSSGPSAPSAHRARPGKAARWPRLRQRRPGPGHPPPAPCTAG